MGITPAGAGVIEEHRQRQVVTWGGAPHHRVEGMPATRRETEADAAGVGRPRFEAASADQRRGG